MAAQYTHFWGMAKYNTFCLVLAHITRDTYRMRIYSNSEVIFCDMDEHAPGSKILPSNMVESLFLKPDMCSACNILKHVETLARVCNMSKCRAILSWTCISLLWRDHSLALISTKFCLLIASGVPTLFIRTFSCARQCYQGAAASKCLGPTEINK